MGTKDVPVQFVRHYETVQHVCPQCGTAFEAPRLRRYCTDRCQWRAAWERSGVERNARRAAKRQAQRQGGGEAQ